MLAFLADPTIKLRNDPPGSQAKKMKNKCRVDCPKAIGLEMDVQRGRLGELCSDNPFQ